MLEFSSLYVPTALVTDRRFHVNSQTFAGLHWKKKKKILYLLQKSLKVMNLSTILIMSILM